MRFLLVFMFTLMCLTASQAQDEAEPGSEDNGFLINLVQEKISSPTRQIQFFGVSGALSSEASIDRITVADTEGVWLEINQIKLSWTRSALLLGRLNISEISAGSVVVSRKPVATEAVPEELPDPAEGSFQLPDLPVSVRIDKASIASITLAEPVIGTSAELDFAATLVLDDGSLASRLVINRLDGSRGSLELNADFTNENEQLNVDVTLQEPPNGVLASLLKIEDRPEIALRVNGSGPLSDFDAKLQLDVDKAALVSGDVEIQNTDEGRGFSASIVGNVQPLIPPAYRDFFAGNTLIASRGLVPASGGVRLDALLVESAGLQLTGDALVGPDGFPKSANLSGQIGNPDGAVTLLPIAGADTTLQSAKIDVTLGDTGTWTGIVGLDQLDTGEFLLDTASLNFNGTVANIDMPGQRRLTARLDGVIEGIEADDPKLARAIGQRIDLATRFNWSEQAPLIIEQASLSGNGLDINLDGQFRDSAFFGDLSAEIADLSPLSGIAERALSGRITFATSGTVRPLTGGFNLQLTGDAADLGIGDPRVDPLLAGNTILRGGVSRDANGFRTDRFELSNPQVSIKADGGLSLVKTDLTIGASLTDIGLATDLASGPVNLIAEAKGGETGPIALELVATLPDTRLRDRRLQAGRVAIQGDLQRNRDISGQISGSGILDGVQTALTGDLEVTKTLKALRNFNFVTDGASITGGIEQDTDGLFSGDLDLRAPDISTAAALALQEASGSVIAAITLEHSNGKQNLQTQADINQLSIAGLSMDSGTIDAAIEDILGIPLVDGEAHLRQVTYGSQGLTRLDMVATQNGKLMSVQADADLLNGTHTELEGTLEQLDPGFRVLLEKLLLQQGEVEARLDGQTRLEIMGQNLSLSPLVLAIEEGSLSLSGEVSDTLALDLEANAIPLSIANTINAAFGVGGSFDGTAKVSGDRSSPQIDFQTTLTDFTAAPLTNAGLPPLSLTARGETDASILKLNAALTSANGIDATVSGAIPISPEAGELDVAVDLKSLPLLLLNAVVKGQGIRGAVSGTAAITGPLDDIAASFDLAGRQIGATVLDQNGIGALQADIAGQFGGQTITLQNAQVNGPQGLRFTATGSVPLSGPGLAVAVNGLLPLGLANTALAAQSMQASGDLQIAANVTGNINQPEISGRANMSGGVFIMPLANLRLQNINLVATLTRQQIVLDEFRGDFAAGGRAEASGTVSLNVAQGMPADLNLRLVRAVYSDGSVLTTKISSDINVTGPLLRVPLIAGEVNIDETNIVLPERFSSSQEELLDARHFKPPRNVQMTLDRAGIGKAAKAEASGQGFDARLDVQINAIDRIFIRGWGLDAELGGKLRLTGTISDVNPIGAFNLIRGRIAIAGKRLDFREGRMTFEGSLNPEVYFQTQTRSGEYTIFLTISGELPEPEILFTSTPDLPEDEALAQLLFGTSVDSLSAFQIAQLAGAVAFLAGGGRPGLVDKLRSGIGLDNLDFTTSDDGETAVNAGKYIDDNIYFNLEAEADGGTTATITLDITEEFKAKGSVESDGESTMGIYFERDY